MRPSRCTLLRRLDIGQSQHPACLASCRIQHQKGHALRPLRKSSLWMATPDTHLLSPPLGAFCSDSSEMMSVAAYMPGRLSALLQLGIVPTRDGAWVAMRMRLASKGCLPLASRSFRRGSQRAAFRQCCSTRASRCHQATACRHHWCQLVQDHSPSNPRLQLPCAAR